MKFNLIRLPLLPAFVLLVALATAAMGDAGASAADASELLLPGSAGHSDALPLILPRASLLEFQASCPIGSRWIGGLLILFTGLTLGRLTARYNLYSVGTCLAIPLYAALVCGLASDCDFLPALLAAALLALATKNLCRSFCNGFGFDAIFRGALYLGLLLLTDPSALPLPLSLLFAALLFRRTLREVAIALGGLLLPLFAYCYINWGLGGTFTAPLGALYAAATSGTPLTLIFGMPLSARILAGTLAALDLMAVLFFFANIYIVGTKARSILIFYSIALALAALAACGPAASPGILLLAAVPSTVLLPYLFIRLHRNLALPLLLLLLAGCVAAAFRRLPVWLEP